MPTGLMDAIRYGAAGTILFFCFVLMLFLSGIVFVAKTILSIFI
jgi:hypothetical protein